MNTLSWFIYAIDVVNSINIISVVLIAILFPIAILTKLGGAFVEVDRVYDIKEGFHNKFVKDNHPFTVKGMIIAWVLVTALVIVVPGRHTLILIAASEYGEKVLNNPKVQDIVDPSIDLLKTWIEKEKKELLEDKK